MGSFIGRLFRGDQGPRQPGPPLPGAGPRFLPGGEERIYRGSRTVAGSDPATGKRVFRAGVGFSTGSQREADDEAEREAQRALRDALAGRNKEAGGYAYLADRRAEPLVEILRGPFEEAARITVNTYGSIVMNAKAALFADVDVADWVEDGPDPRSTDAPAALRDVLGRRPELAVRVYRTKAGWRYLVTNRLFDPTAEDTRTLLLELGADPKYELLCRVQRSFRARLTPKPWRAGRRALWIGATKGVGRQELQTYVDATWSYATARFISGAGPADTIAEIKGIVDYHDRWTQAASEKTLA